jgi:class 3 adenylate cyclase
VERLADTIERGDELTVARLRPYALADAWRAGRRDVLELCLRATRVGLLDLRWDLLCPLCRGVKETAATLADVRSRAHCETCIIDFTVNFEQSVELTFRPSASVREVEARAFCLAGPGVTPHVAGQQLLAPGEERELVLDLETGRYRLRTLQLPGARAAVVEDGGAEAVAVRLGDPAWPGGELRLARTPTLCVANESEREQLLVVERTAWSDQAATAAEVTALQLFRDLFANEALRPDEPISVGSLTVVFTDLRDSTRFYRQVGDAPAFGSVMSHLDVLREAVAGEGGAVVKTMGDAVMAVFRRPASAVRALLAAQRTLAAAATPPLSLKAGVHHGACIAVRQNDRLDYFGSTVNAAARLVDLSAGDEMVVSDAVRSDPEVADLLAERPELELEPLLATLKGFDEERFALWRLRARVDSVEDARAAAR